MSLFQCERLYAHTKKRERLFPYKKLEKPCPRKKKNIIHNSIVQATPFTSCVQGMVSVQGCQMLVCVEVLVSIQILVCVEVLVSAQRLVCSSLMISMFI